MLFRSDKVRFVRYINDSFKPVDVNIKEFSLTYKKGSNILNALDGILATSTFIFGEQTFPINGGEKVVILTSKYSKGIVYAISNGESKEIGSINGSYSEFELPSNTSALRLMGEMEVFEVITF